MNLQEAIESNMPFKRKAWIQFATECVHIYANFKIARLESQNKHDLSVYKLTKEDILATDYETKQ